MIAMPETTINKRTVRIGFIGLGLMGSRLTRRLHSSGWNVQAWNRSPDPENSLVSPLRANLAGLPPLLVQVGSAETLLDDAVRISARAGSEGFISGGSRLERYDPP